MYEDRRLYLKLASQGALFVYTGKNFWKCQLLLEMKRLRSPDLKDVCKKQKCLICFLFY